MAGDSDRLRKLAKEHPEAFRRVADAADDDLQDRLRAVLDSVVSNDGEEPSKGNSPE